MASSGAISPLSSPWRRICRCRVDETVLTSGFMKIANPPWKQFLPKSVSCLKDYSAKIFAADLAAGITVGLVALPLAMAFAIASGLTPQAGIYCAVVTGFIISALGGSKTQIGGP